MSDTTYKVLVAVLSLFGLVWLYQWWVWRQHWLKSRGQLPHYGQVWRSSNGRTLYILRVEKNDAEHELAVIFTDVAPTEPTKRSFRWSLHAWRDLVDRRRLVLDAQPWYEK